MDPESLIRFVAARELDGEMSADELLADFESSDLELFEFLAARGLGEKEEILRIVALDQARDFVDLDPEGFPSTVLHAIDPEITRIFECVPIQVSEDSAKVCMSDPFDHVAVRELGGILNKRIEVAIADPEKIAAVLARSRHGHAGDESGGVVAASLGHNAKDPPSTTPLRSTAVGSFTLLSFCVLALTAMAGAAMFTAQSKRLQEWKALVESNEATLRQIEALRKGSETSIVGLEMALKDLESRFAKKEAEALQLQQVEKDLVKLKGELGLLEEVLSKATEPVASETAVAPGTTDSSQDRVAN